MIQDFPLECECCICGKYKFCPTKDDDLNARLCNECLPHLIHANEIIIDDLRNAGFKIKL